MAHSLFIPDELIVVCLNLLINVHGVGASPGFLFDVFYKLGIIIGLYLN